jgi:peptidoglycan hydrolase CwlO-like protein
MKIKVFIISVLIIAFANSASAQDKNPVLKNTFRTSGGQFIVADIWNELRISDLSYETVKTLINAVESLKNDLQNANRTISEQKRKIEQMQREFDEQKRKIDKMEDDIRNLKNKVK